MEEPDLGQLRFRRATDGDVTSVVDLVESAYRGERSRAGWTTEADLLGGQRTDRRSVQAAIERPDVVLLLAQVDDEVVGCCQLQVVGDDCSHFGLFAVRPGLQGRRIGSALLAEAERVAGRAGAGAPVVRMEVIAQREDLIAWYERRDYARTGETAPFPYGDTRFGLPRRDDLHFVVLEKVLAGEPPTSDR